MWLEATVGETMKKVIDWDSIRQILAAEKLKNSHLLPEKEIL